MARSVTVRVLTAVAGVLLLLVTACVVSGATSQNVAAGVSPNRASQGAVGSSNGSGRGDADGELSKDEAPRAAATVRRRRETGEPTASGRHHRVRDAVGVPVHPGTAAAGTGSQAGTGPQRGRGTPAAGHLARLQVFRC